MAKHVTVEDTLRHIRKALDLFEAAEGNGRILALAYVSFHFNRLMCRAYEELPS
jgi:hypothetical protein